MDEIGKEETALEAQIDELRRKIGGADSIGANVSSAQALFAELSTSILKYGDALFTCAVAAK